MKPSIPSAFALIAFLALVTGATVTKPPVPKTNALKSLPRAVSAGVVGQQVNVLLSWDYPSAAELSPDLVFRVYSSLNPTDSASWTLLTNTASTSIVIPMVPSSRYFRVGTYSVFWDLESPPSPEVSTPPAPRGDSTLTIRRAP